MSPLGFFLIALGIVVIIIGVKGSQHEVVKALKGKA